MQCIGDIALDTGEMTYFTFFIIHRRWKQDKDSGSVQFRLTTSILSEISILPDSQCTGGVLENKIHERKNSREKRCEN